MIHVKFNLIDFIDISVFVNLGYRILDMWPL